MNRFPNRYFSWRILSKGNLYLLCYGSAFSGFQWTNCEMRLFVSVCARVVRAIQMFSTSNQGDWWTMNCIWCCLLRLHDKTKPKFEKKFTNKVQVSDGIRLIKGAFKAPVKPWWMTAISLHQSMQQTTWLSAQTCCTWSKNRKLLMVYLVLATVPTG